jgi:hypothetical protein
VPSLCGINIPSGGCSSTNILIHCKKANRGLLHGIISVIIELVLIE